MVRYNESVGRQRLWSIHSTKKDDVGLEHDDIMLIPHCLTCSGGSGHSRGLDVVSNLFLCGLFLEVVRIRKLRVEDLKTCSCVELPS